MTVVNEMTARMPWLYAEGGSWWHVWGKVSERHSVSGCVAQAIPNEITGVDDGEEFALFRVWVHTSDMLLLPADRITHAKRIVFVLADEPARALYEHEQDFIDAGVVA